MVILGSILLSKEKFVLIEFFIIIKQSVYTDEPFISI